ncbi:hypothetical protein HYQ46_006123 [Verticillium longisporum]|nr:hypothetical protein HYQ46_006123 [Verticillium longisporum]
MTASSSCRLLPLDEVVSVFDKTGRARGEDGSCRWVSRSLRSSELDGSRPNDGPTNFGHAVAAEVWISLTIRSSEEWMVLAVWAKEAAHATGLLTFGWSRSMMASLRFNAPEPAVPDGSSELSMALKMFWCTEPETSR